MKKELKSSKILDALENEIGTIGRKQEIHKNLYNDKHFPGFQKIPSDQRKSLINMEDSYQQMFV